MSCDICKNQGYLISCFLFWCRSDINGENRVSTFKNLYNSCLCLFPSLKASVSHFFVSFIFIYFAIKCNNNMQHKMIIYFYTVYYVKLYKVDSTFLFSRQKICRHSCLKIETWVSSITHLTTNNSHCNNFK